jgi:4-carboxymuconolactone decarboxylase
MTEDEATIYDFSIELLKAPAVSDETFARARDAFGERGVVELTHVLGFYGMISLVLKMAEIGAPDGSTPLESMADPFPLAAV